jgi:NADPH:quinone reductase-like Zn-dependent oxidoreductase
VQIAVALGAEVTGVCSTGNVELVRSLGAKQVIDYTRDDFTRGGRRYDLILDNVGDRSFAECRRVLTPGGIHLPNSGRAGMGYFAGSFMRSIVVRQQGRPYLSTPNRDDLVVLKGLLESGRIKPVISRTYGLSETPEALRAIGEGHVAGKAVITVG